MFTIGSVSFHNLTRLPTSPELQVRSVAHDSAKRQTERDQPTAPRFGRQRSDECDHWLQAQEGEHERAEAEVEPCAASTPRQAREVAGVAVRLQVRNTAKVVAQNGRRKATEYTEAYQTTHTT